MGASLSDTVQLTTELQPRSMRLGSRVSHMRREYCERWASTKCLRQTIARLELSYGGQTNERTHYHGELHRSPSPRETRVYPVGVFCASCHHGIALGGSRIRSAGQCPVCAHSKQLCLYRRACLAQRAYEDTHGDIQDQRRLPVCESTCQYSVYGKASGQQQPAASCAPQLPAHEPFVPYSAPTPIHSSVAGSFTAASVRSSSSTAVALHITGPSTAVAIHIAGSPTTVPICDYATGSPAAANRSLLLPTSPDGSPLAAP
jgi:hypothetical protein